MNNISERNKIIFDMINSGSSYREVGKKTGLTGTRIRQLYLRRFKKELEFFKYMEKFIKEYIKNFENIFKDYGLSEDFLLISEEIDKENNKEDIYKKPIRFLKLTIKEENCLKAGEIYFVGDLLYKSEMDLLSIPNLGKSCLKNIKLSLANNGLYLSK